MPLQCFYRVLSGKHTKHETGTCRDVWVCYYVLEMIIVTIFTNNCSSSLLIKYPKGSGDYCFFSLFLNSFGCFHLSSLRDLQFFMLVRKPGERSHISRLYLSLFLTAVIYLSNGGKRHFEKSD